MRIACVRTRGALKWVRRRSTGWASEATKECRRKCAEILGFLRFAERISVSATAGLREPNRTEESSPEMRACRFEEPRSHIEDGSRDRFLVPSSRAQSDERRPTGAIGQAASDEERAAIGVAKERRWHDHRPMKGPGHVDRRRDVPFFPLPQGGLRDDRGT
jgi:hypothetical protein